MIDFLYPFFKLDALNSFTILAIALFFALTLIYSFRFMRENTGIGSYYINIFLTAIVSVGAVLSNNLLLLLVFWGFLGITLFLLINMGGDKADLVAKKTFIIVGGSDALMLLGIGIIYLLTGTVQMDKISLGLTNSPLHVFAYICIAVACFANEFSGRT